MEVHVCTRTHTHIHTHTHTHTHTPHTHTHTHTQAYYPETLANLYIINAPWIFHPLWALIKPWLDPVTKNKFHILGSSFREKLQEVIDLDQLPVEYGGKCVCEGRWGTGCVPPVKEYVPPQKTTL